MITMTEICKNDNGGTYITSTFGLTLSFSEGRLGCLKWELRKFKTGYFAKIWGAIHTSRISEYQLYGWNNAFHHVKLHSSGILGKVVVLSRLKSQRDKRPEWFVFCNVSGAHALPCSLGCSLLWGGPFTGIQSPVCPMPCLSPFFQRLW